MKKEKKKREKKRVKLTRSKVTNRSRFEQATKEIEVPELNSMMGFLPAAEVAELERIIDGNEIVIKRFEETLLGFKEEENSPEIDSRIVALEKKIEELKAQTKEAEENNNVTTIIIKQLGLPEYLKIRGEVNDLTFNLMEGMIHAAIRSDFVEDAAIEAMKGFNPDVKYRMEVVKNGVVEPKLNWTDIVYIGNNWPEAILKISTEILILTSGGATLKKNS